MPQKLEPDRLQTAPHKRFFAHSKSGFRSRPFKAPQLKALADTARKDRARTVVDLPLVEASPAPPAWLSNCHARDEWARLAPVAPSKVSRTSGAVWPMPGGCTLGRAAATNRPPIYPFTGWYCDGWISRRTH